MGGNSFQQRFVQFMELYGVTSVEDLARRLGYSRGERIQKFLRNPDSRPSFETIEDIARVFADLNIKWLVTGDGAPLLEDDSSPAKSDHGIPRNTSTEAPDLGMPRGMPRGVSSPSAPPGSVRFVLHSGEGGEGEDAYGLLLEGLRRHHQAEEARFAAMARQMDELRAEVMALRRQLDER